VQMTFLCKVDRLTRPAFGRPTQFCSGSQHSLAKVTMANRGSSFFGSCISAKVSRCIDLCASFPLLHVAKVVAQKSAQPLLFWYPLFFFCVCSCVLAFLHSCVLAFVCSCVRAFVRSCVLAFVRSYVLACLRACVLACLRACVLAFAISCLPCPFIWW
jgi:hypothetical protein